ncbi:MAG TPA: anthranilate synthase component I family protein [Verrucomicrobiales bacterium]|nr:anthranilate synthase component I family protein [Verrucomicrobiales bacterium]
MDWSWDPGEAFWLLRGLPGLAFLDTSSGNEAGGISILGACPSRVMRGRFPDCAGLRRVLRERERETADFGLPVGGWIGSIDYDGSYRFGCYETLLLYRHADGVWLATGDAGWLEGLSGHALPAGRELEPRLRFQREMERRAFIERVLRAQEYIAAGDIYQVNLSHRHRSRDEAETDPVSVYGALRRVSPAPHAAYLDEGDRVVLSSSPECFLRASGRWVATRPIKGTRPRFADAARDERSACELLTSRKELAELVMITDLERNDLGKVCEYGSVRVRELLKLERFEQVYHLVSTVEGTLRPGVDHLDLLAACWPGGSISGAPKKRAMEIIAELEPVPRGLYTGAVGYLGFNSESQFSIVIRTLIREGGYWQFHVGAGIVADSDPEAEWEETLYKAAGILRAAGEPGWEPSEENPRLKGLPRVSRTKKRLEF